MDAYDIVDWVNETLDYRRPGWSLRAVTAPCPHVDIDATWVMVTVTYTEPNTNPDLTGDFTQNRHNLLDPNTIEDLDALRAWTHGTILWSLIHEDRELLREGPDAIAFYHPHIPVARAYWATARNRILAMVE